MADAWVGELKWIITTVIAGAGLLLTFLEFRRKARQPPGTEHAGPAPLASAGAELAGYRIFAPEPTVGGEAEMFLNRTSELRTLTRAVKGKTSVISIEGLGGVGKTALAAALCQHLPRRHHMRWVSCSERTDLTLRLLASGLAYDPKLSRFRPLQHALGQPKTDAPLLINTVVLYLAERRIVLVLDNYHDVSDDGVRDLVATLEHSRLRSTVVLTSRQQEVVVAPLAKPLVLGGLASSEARRFLRDRQVDAPDDVLDEVWAKSGRGVPEAMKIFAGLSVDHGVADTLGRLPVYTQDLKAWIELLLDDLTPPARRLAGLIAFVYEPVSRELLREIAPPRLPVDESLAELRRRFVLTTDGRSFVMHDLFRDHTRTLLSPAAKRTHSSRIAQHYQRRARELLLPDGDEIAPSYGPLYLECFPDYIDDAEAHQRLVDDLVQRLDDCSLAPTPGARVLVLGSGNGIHDAGLAKHQFTVVNVDFQEEIAAIGRDRAATLAGRISYVRADMVRQPLPFAAASIDAVLNIGSSFGYEASDGENAAVFRHAAQVLKPGQPFVFEYVNGRYWERERVKRELDVVTLPNGAVRTEYRIIDPAARTSLSCISLQRPDGSVGWLHHFMHYYSLPEIEQMMREAGLEPIATYGAVDGRVVGEAFDPDGSAAMVVIAVRR